MLIVIPARWGSTRLPGKPLVPIAGRPLLVRVIDLARAAMLEIEGATLVVATDDERVAELAGQHGIRAVMTDARLASGSDRVLAAAIEMGALPSTPVINLQGDAPFVPPTALVALATALSEGASVATPVHRLTWLELDALREHKRISPFSGTTCMVAADGSALWFSKQILPSMRAEAELRRMSDQSPVRQHLGLYGYTVDALSHFAAARPTEAERLEGLEQLRFLELGIAIRTIDLEGSLTPMGGIDTLEDVACAERWLGQQEEPASP